MWYFLHVGSTYLRNLLGVFELIVGVDGGGVEGIGGGHGGKECILLCDGKHWAVAPWGASVDGGVGDIL